MYLDNILKYISHLKLDGKTVFSTIVSIHSPIEETKLALEKLGYTVELTVCKTSTSFMIMKVSW